MGTCQITAIFKDIDFLNSNKTCRHLLLILVLKVIHDIPILIGNDVKTLLNLC